MGRAKGKDVEIKDLRWSKEMDAVTIPNLFALGYGIFNRTQQFPSLVSMALGEIDSKREFATLMDDHEPEVVSLAAKLLENGLPNPIDVGKTYNGYCLIGGTKFVLGVLYNHCKTGGVTPTRIKATVLK